MSVELMKEVTDALTKFREDITGELKKVEESSGQKADEAKKVFEARIDEIQKGLDAVKVNQEQKHGLPGCEKDAKSFDMAKFFKALVAAHRGEGTVETCFAKHAPLEGELSREYMKARTYVADDGTSGGFLIPPEVYMGQIIEPTYAQTPILNFPVLKFSNLRADMPIPVPTSNTTAYHLAENGKPTVSTNTWGLKWLRPRKIGVFTKISNRLLSESTENVQTLISGYMAQDASVELSRGLTNGVGAGSEPKGIAQYTAQMTAGISAAGNRFLIDQAIALQQKLAVANELRDTNTYAYLMRPEAYFGMLRERVIQYSGQARANGMPVMSPSLFVNKADLQGALSAQIGHTTQIAATDTYSTSSTCSKVFYGDWSKFAFATFRDPVFKVSDVAGDGSTGSAFLEDQTYLVTFLEYDCNVLRPAAFTYCEDVETAEGSWTV